MLNVGYSFFTGRYHKY